MKTEVRHRESWQVTVHREADSGWPDAAPVNPLSARSMKPETVSFMVVAGHEHPESIEAFGTYLDGPNKGKLANSRFHYRRVPPWLATIIEDARQHWHLTPPDVGPDVQPGHPQTAHGTGSTAHPV